MLMSLDMFAFSSKTALFDQLRRRRTWRHPTNDRVGMRAAGQYAGPGEDTISVSGVIAPGQLGRRDALDQLAALAATGAAHPLVDGEGYVYGAFVIESIDDTRRNFGTTAIPRWIDFTIDLRRMDDDEGEVENVGAPERG